MKMCEACWGEGQIECRDAVYYAVWERCKTCGGTGEIEDEEE